ncbi:MAG TPA: hypothetical protein VIO33_10700, partial [Burkholderiaceae bacterium]
LYTDELAVRRGAFLPALRVALNDRPHLTARRPDSTFPFCISDMCPLLWTSSWQIVTSTVEYAT